jgi:DNA-binding HxlR family transcriptional regulator
MTEDVRQQEDRADGEVMRSLMDAYPALMTVEEIRRDLREPQEHLLTDAINRLDSAGLIHRFGDFIFPTRAAYLAGRLEYFAPGS